MRQGKEGDGSGVREERGSGERYREKVDAMRECGECNQGW